MSKNSRCVWKNWKFWAGIIIAILIIVFIMNYNGLSEYETMEKFLDLVSQSEFDKAKKYITSNFEWDLASVKKKNFERKESFLYKYGNYCLENNYDIAYIDNNSKEMKFASIYKFKIKQTIFGYKIDDYQYETVEY